MTIREVRCWDSVESIGLPNPRIVIPTAPAPDSFADFFGTSFSGRRITYIGVT
jgi:hypothetical protein